MANITIDEIKSAACGVDENGKGKSLIIAGLQKFEKANPDKEPESLMEVSTLDAILDIKTFNGHSYLNLKFPSPLNSDLALFFRCLERYLEESDTATNEKYELVCFMTIIPLELEGQYMINATFPIFWALEPDAIGDALRNLRVLFIPDDVQFIYSDLMDADFAKMVDQVSASTDIELAKLEEEDDDGLTDYERNLTERNRAFTDAKYDFSNNADPFNE